MYSVEEIRLALGHVIDPDLGKDLVSLNMIQNLKVRDGTVGFDLILTTPACPLKDQLVKECTDAIHRYVADDIKVDIEVGAQVSSSRPQDELLPEVKNVVAVASGKGGVGKSSVAVNMAICLANDGASVGLLDADIYGPSIPTMLGLEGARPKVQKQGDKNMLVPLEKYGIKTLSIGFLLDEKQPVVWRGPMVSGAIKQLVSDGLWGALDYLIVDLPPGTGDVQLTLVQSVPVTGAIIVTTPQQVAIADATKALAMFQMGPIQVPVLGVIENMSWFEQKGSGVKSYLFGKGGGEKLAAGAGISLLGQIPLLENIMQGSDTGKPSALDGSEAAEIFIAVARALAQKVSIRNEEVKPTEKVKVSTI